MTEEKMLEYGKFSVELERISNIGLPIEEIKERLEKAKNNLHYWQDIKKQKDSGVDPEQLKSNLMKELDNFSFN